MARPMHMISADIDTYLGKPPRCLKVMKKVKQRRQPLPPLHLAEWEDLNLEEEREWARRELG
eukprot:CAMPEP_0174721144 /NCGR_PEP_ID=MMETSP1094-20130205/35420_1 /TAXON_ID=156173 /ORGANISM="Chrysochromulina brevifilum, Strain UTEX LB 985" /LENGTH=61 /DNA_ID=CAMNT_0015921773 /DNA_START=118 /DNA_END=299 /DNA_ORIENTATION=+